ncbi:MAG: hypothetical protein ACKO96_41550, partial [Flammeovirgaceae bacterium]
MKTKFTPPPVRSLAMLCFAVLIFTICNGPSQEKSPDQVLIERLTSRLKNKDYVSIRSLNNPYDQIGFKIAEFRQEISNNPNFPKLIRAKNSNKPKIAQAGFFSFVSANDETWGIENNENLQMVKSLIQESKERKGEHFNPAKIDQINDRLLNYSKDAK